MPRIKAYSPASLYRKEKVTTKPLVMNTQANTLTTQAKSTLTVSHTSPKVQHLRAMRIVEEIAAYNRIDNYTSTLKGEMAQYRRFTSLLDLNDQNFLVDMLNYNNPTVKAYAYWGLVKQAYPHLEQLLLSFKDNPQMVSYDTGVNYKKIRLLDFMLDISIQESFKMGRILVKDSTVVALRRK